MKTTFLSLILATAAQCALCQQSDSIAPKWLMEAVYFWGLDHVNLNDDPIEWEERLSEHFNDGEQKSEVISKVGALSQGKLFRPVIMASNDAVDVTLYFPQEHSYYTWSVTFMFDREERLKDVLVSRGSYTAAVVAEKYVEEANERAAERGRALRFWID